MANLGSSIARNPQSSHFFVFLVTWISVATGVDNPKRLQTSHNYLVNQSEAPERDQVFYFGYGRGGKWQSNAIVYGTQKCIRFDFRRLRSQ